MFIITNEKEVQPVGCVLPNTLVHGDCLEVMKYIPDGSIDLVLQCVTLNIQLYEVL